MLVFSDTNSFALNSPFTISTKPLHHLKSQPSIGGIPTSEKKCGNPPVLKERGLIIQSLIINNYGLAK
jgi:hypothetical protein